MKNFTNTIMLFKKKKKTDKERKNNVDGREYFLVLNASLSLKSKEQDGWS